TPARAAERSRRGTSRRSRRDRGSRRAARRARRPSGAPPWRSASARPAPRLRRGRRRSACCRRRPRAASRREPSGLALVFAAQRLADALCERLGSQGRLVALAAQFLDRDVAGGEDLRPRDDPRRAVLVPYPDVLELELEEREAAGRARRRLLHFEP